MDDIFYEKLLYRIIQGRLRLFLGDLVLCIYEPTKDLLEESLDIYESTYNKAYFSGIPIKSELIETLVNNELWSPFDDREADKIEKSVEELKIEAYKNYFSSKKLRGIKMNIRHLEKIGNKYKSKKHVLDHTSCEGTAEFARIMWIISKTTFTTDNELYDWSNHNINFIVNKYHENQITSSQFRKIARSDPWRPMWLAAKKQSNVFGKPTTHLTKDQLALCSFSSFYDNVFESHESPPEAVIEDDDCLDGWSLVRRREHEKQIKEKQTDDKIKNPKIRNSQEIFIAASDREEASQIYDLNDPMARSVVKQRENQIVSSGPNMKFTELHDVQQDISIQRTQQAISTTKGRAK